MAQDISNSDVLWTGQHQFERAPSFPAGSFGDAQIGSTSPIAQTKLQQQHVRVYSQPNGSAATTERKVVHVARVAGTVFAGEAGIVTAAVGAATVTVDLRKNGTTVLTSVVTIDNTKVAYQRTAGGIATAAYVAGDVFEVVVTATAGGGTLPQGLFADFTFREGAG